MAKRKGYHDTISMLEDMHMPKKFIEAVQDGINRRSLSHMLTALRFKKGWSQTRMAKELDWSQAKVSRFEMKKNDDMKFGDLMKYCAMLGTDFITAK
jgi:DNA-binding Xre family transcriptional regulator